MLQLKEVIDRYSGQTSATDQIIQGFMQYEAYKNDPEYIEYLEMQRSFSSCNSELDSLTSFIRDNETQIREMQQEEEVVDKRKLSNLATAVKAFEERKRLIQAETNQYRTELQTLHAKFN